MTLHINNARQNHPELVVRDLYHAFNVPPEATRWILWWRGVAKWLSVRRLLISLKHRWLKRIHEIQHAKRVIRRIASTPQERAYLHQLIGEQRALEQCRQQVRALCHSPRDIEWPTDPRKWPEESRLPDEMPPCPNKRWLARFLGKTAA